MITTALLLLAVVEQAATIPPEARQFDFWVGKWDAIGRIRTSPDSDKWTETKCSNEIRKVQQGRVIEENFSSPGFTGQSWSVYNTARKLWQQTWVDSSGGYLLFEGTFANGEMILNQVGVAGKPNPAMRMIFRAITKDSFQWNWQQADPQGEFKTVWELNYSRKKARK